VFVENLKPWPHHVDGVDLVNALAATFRTYIALPPHADVALALLVLMTWCFEVLSIAPKVAITSPVKRCGKTNLLVLIASLVRRPLLVSNITAPALFRAIEKFQPTLLIDEADTFLKNNESLRGIINSGHTRKTAVVVRCSGENHEPRGFSTWCPQAIACIGRLHTTVADRSINIRLRRRAPTETITRLRLDQIDQDCEPLRQQAARWALDYLDAIREADPRVPDINDRAQDCWRSLLAIAEQAGASSLDAAWNAAVGLSTADREDSELSIELLSDIRILLKATGNADFVGSTWLRNELLRLEDRPWHDFAGGRAISSKRIASLLADFEVLPISSGTLRGYGQDRFDDAFARYLPLDEASTRQDAPKNRMVGDIQSPDRPAITVTGKR
jgi:putative DNA primase/helicase